MSGVAAATSPAGEVVAGKAVAWDPAKADCDEVPMREKMRNRAMSFGKLANLRECRRQMGRASQGRKVPQATSMAVGPRR